jgi:hypothetical protein
MKTLIYFNRPDCPENMGISQLTDNLNQFLADRSSIIVNPTISNNILTFDKQANEEGIVERGYAILTETPEDFQN